MAEVRFERVTKSFGTVEVIPSLDLTVGDGSFTVLVGPSGCGKSTLLRMISGLELTTSGRIFIGGSDVTDEEPSHRSIAMVFQSYALYPHMTVAENIGFGLMLAKRPKQEIESAVRQAADTLRLDRLLDRKPKALSGGQRQRVAIGRAIVRKPKVFLFDEPLSNLDAALRAEMRVELAELHARIGATMIYVTHDQVEAMTMADDIISLNEGRVEQQGPPMSLYREPLTPFVAGFIGSPKMNLKGGRLAEANNCDTYGIRPEHLAFSEAADAWPMRIKLVETLGAESIIHLNSGEHGDFVMRTDGDESLAAGAEVSVAPKAGMEHFFRDGRRVRSSAPADSGS